MMTLALIVGLWSTTCIQTQISGNHEGFTVESYEISEDGHYEFKREWFLDSACSQPRNKEFSEIGTIKMGSKLSGMFIQLPTFEADFTNEAGTDLGAIAIKDGHSIKVGRGLKGSSFRNTMVGIFEYTKK